MKRKLITLFVLLGTIGLAQAGCKSGCCGSPAKTEKVTKKVTSDCNKCKTGCCGNKTKKTSDCNACKSGCCGRRK
ncbi:MAG TPA: hypothetical protein QGF02_04030 [Candidatus Babeliales bacterium]|nr:hypothetical protein [Candidatus Babeliales bacterium]